jgi:hypothetical protein
MRTLHLISLAALVALGGCAGVGPGAGTTVSVVNNLSFDNAMTGKRDGLRSAWPATALAGSSEQFPMAQIKQCEPGGACSWGVLKAHRRFGKVQPVADGVMVEVEVALEVDRSLRAKGRDLDATLTIPADVGALQANMRQTRSMTLKYGEVARMDFKYGISYELCALRIDAARLPVDRCEVAYH